MAPPAAAGAKLGSLTTMTTPLKAVICVLVPGLIGLAYWILFYSDVTAKIEQAQRQQDGFKTELATQQQAQASYFADRDELALRQQRQRELNKVLPPDTEAASFLSSIQQVSNTSGVSLNALQPLEERAEAFFVRVPMKLEMSGHFHQLAKFAYEVGKIDRIINLENIDISEAKVTGDDTIVKVKCLATAFHAPVVEAKGKR